MYKIEKRNCPICLKYNGKKIIKSEVDLNKNLFEIDKYWRGFYKTRVFFDYYRCNLCQLLYCKEYLDDTMTYFARRYYGRTQIAQIK